MPPLKIFPEQPPPPGLPSSIPAHSLLASLVLFPGLLLLMYKGGSLYFLAPGSQIPADLHLAQDSQHC